MLTTESNRAARTDAATGLAEPINISGFTTAEIRDRILTAVTKLIAEHGIDGMTMRMVADEAGLSTGTINYHFNNKRGLVIAALERVYRVPDNFGTTKGPAVEKLRVLTQGFVLRTVRTRNWWRFWLDYSAHAARDAELRSHQVERFDRQRAFFENVIAAAVSSGEFPLDVMPELAADTLLNLAYGLALRQTMEPSAQAARDARHVLDASIDGLASA